MPTYKLYYFPGRGRAELSRLCFKAQGVDFEDIRISGDDWQKKKPNTITGKMPILEVDGEQLPEGDAIARYIARKHDLAGKDSWETAQTDVILGICNDLRKELYQAHFEKDENVKKEKMGKLSSETFPTYLATFEKILKKNGGGDGYIVGSGLTIADLALLDMLDTPLEHNLASLDAVPKFKAHRKRISELPRIKQWVDSRPTSQF